MTEMPNTLNEYAAEAHQISTDHGFNDTHRNFGEVIALIHSELSEALEADRAGEPLVWFNGSGKKPEGAAIELIDAIIRILDYLGGTDLDIDGLYRTKTDYNKTRPRLHGKSY